MATTRLRRTIHYPSDSDDPPDLDEEHQEELLTNLKTQDDATNNLYRHVFLAFPVVVSLVYLPGVVSSTGAPDLFLALLKVAVPAVAAFVLYFHPILQSGQPKLHSLLAASQQDSSTSRSLAYVILSGAGLASLLAIIALQRWCAGKLDETIWTGLPSGMSHMILSIPRGRFLQLILTAVTFMLTLLVRHQLSPVDLEELRQARYELKGA